MAAILGLAVRPAALPGLQSEQGGGQQDGVRQAAKRIPACAPRCFPAATRRGSAGWARQGCDVVDHGWRWLDYHGIDEATEREHIRLSVETIRRLTGTRPIGWYIGTPSANTRQNIGARRRARREGEASATIQRGCPAQVSGGAGGGLFSDASRD